MKAISRYAELCQQQKAPGYNRWPLHELMSKGEGSWIDNMLDANYQGIDRSNGKAEDLYHRNRANARAAVDILTQTEGVKAS